jgi:hypothetical protein
MPLNIAFIQVVVYAFAVVGLTEGKSFTLPVAPDEKRSRHVNGFTSFPFGLFFV